MRRHLSPYKSDFAAFALLGIAIAMVVCISAGTLHSKADQARQYESSLTVAG